MSDRRKLKLAYVHNALDSRGGAERKLLLLARHFSNLPNVQLAVYVNSFLPERTFEEYLPGISVELFSASNPLAKLIAAWKIGRLTRDADLIHAHNHPGHIAAVFSKWFRKKPILWFCNEPLLYLSGTRRRENPLKLLGLRLFEKLILPQIDLIVANSQNTQANIKKYLKRDSVVIYSGVDTDLLSPAKENSAKSRPQLLTLSRFTKEKNLDLVLRLAKRCKEFDFVLAGNGPLEEELRQDIRKMDLVNVRLAVNISEQEKVRLYKESDIFIFPTPDEPLGINVVEAMSCGLPVVAHNSGGAKETVVDGETGFLTSTEEEFESRIEELLHAPNLMQTMGLAARRRAVEIFSLDQMIRSTAELYDQLLGEYRNPFRFS